VTVAYPLAWPEGWPRTPPSQRKDGDSSFKRQRDTGRGYKSAQAWTFAAARDELFSEIWRHGAKTCVISSNFPQGSAPSVKGLAPVEGKRRPEDEGVAIYFQRGGKPYVMACDRYHDAEGNFRSLTLALEALRQLERHGGGTMMERAYEGFAALPAPKRWWEVLGVDAAATRVADLDAAAAYRDYLARLPGPSEERAA
jgi:hypothetical protein